MQDTAEMMRGSNETFKNGKNHVQEGFDYKNENVQQKRRLTEAKVGLYGFIFCIFVLATKIIYLYRDDLKAAMLEKRLVSYETITAEGEVMLKHGWQHAVKYSSIWLPLLCGFLTTYFTGLFVYLDSSVPGVQPPSPISPAKYKARSGHTFHSSYVFAIVMGLLVASYMYWQNVSLQF